MTLGPDLRQSRLVISRRTQIVMLVLVIASTLLLTALWQNLTEQTRWDGSPTPVESQVGSERARALTVLRAWDKKRAAAYAAGDAQALRQLYLPLSKSGANDQRVLKQYIARGLHIEEMETQILGVEILAHTSDSLVLVVTDRLASAIVVGKDLREELPRDGANTRQIELKRVDARWLVGEVDEDPTAQPRPAESTARTSES